MAEAPNAMSSAGRRPYRSENRPHSGALASWATVNAATMTPVTNPIPTGIPNRNTPSPLRSFT